MNSQLNYVVARQHPAELIGTAERERLARSAGRTEPSSQRRGAVVRRRLWIALPVFEPRGEAPGAGMTLRRAKLIEVRSHGRRGDACE
jgi:hypothetical protein